MKKLFLLFAILFSAAGAFLSAQNGGYMPLKSNAAVRPFPQPDIIIMPRVVIVGREDLKPIEMTGLSVKINVIGNLAMTTYDMTFQNPNQRTLEGEFIMPLGDRQTVAAIALDMNGKMRDGVVVEKEKGRVAFEAVVRRGVDPALVEKTSGNQFKTRIYPFNANSSRRIKITIEEPLSTSGDSYRYTLPLNFKQKLNFKLTAEVEGDNAPQPKMETDLSFFRFDKAGDSFKASFSAQDYMLDNTISFLLPKSKDSRVFTHKEGGKTYFYADVAVKKSDKTRTPPKTLAIIWDASLSGAKRDIDKETALLDAYFKQIKNAQVYFSTFNLKQSAVKPFVVRDGGWDALKNEIKSVNYDGATRFDGVDLKNTKADEIFLFTDGVSTLGSTALAPGNTRITVINSSPEFNRGALTNAAYKTGGNLINLANTPLDEALTALTSQSVRLIRYEYNAADFTAVTPSLSGAVKENFTFAGILKSAGGNINLVFGYDEKNITETKKITVTAGGDNPAVMRLWAQERIRELETDKDANEAEITALGKQFSVVTDFTSLLVLENLSDYVRFEITPPAELRAEYDAAMANKAKETANKEKSALDEAISQAQEIKDWWKKDFKSTPPPKPYQPLKGVESGRGEEILSDNAAAPQALAAGAPVARRAVAQESNMAYSAEAMGGRASAGAAAMDMAPAAMAERRAVNKSMEGPSAHTAAVSVQGWDPDTPYLRILKKSSDKDLYSDYLKLKFGYSDQPSFYFDVADEFMKRGQKENALIVASNIAEMKLDSEELLRILGYKLLQLGYTDYAIDVFAQILKLRGEDPQSYRDLALAYQAAGKYQPALDNLNKIMLGKWDDRFRRIKQIIFVEMNNIISRHKVNTSKINKELIFNMPVDLRITLGWSSDNTDIDLHVTDPYNEEVYYSHKLSATGGRISDDITQGFGPEEFMIKKAIDGTYKIKTNNFADRRQSVSGPTTLYLDIYTFYGTPKETHQRMMVRTDKVKEDNVIGSVDFSAK